MHNTLKPRGDFPIPTSVASTTSAIRKSKNKPIPKETDNLDHDSFGPKFTEDVNDQTRELVKFAQRTGKEKSWTWHLPPADAKELNSGSRELLETSGIKVQEMTHCPNRLDPFGTGANRRKNHEKMIVLDRDDSKSGDHEGWLFAAG